MLDSTKLFIEGTIKLNPIINQVWQRLRSYLQNKLYAHVINACEKERKANMA